MNPFIIKDIVEQIAKKSDIPSFTGQSFDPAKVGLYPEKMAVNFKNGIPDFSQNESGISENRDTSVQSDLYKSENDGTVSADPNLENKNQNENLDIHEDDVPEKKGGSYGEVFKEGEGDKYEVHHMPADSASYLERNDGPAIKMEKEDHRETASFGSSREAKEYRDEQKNLIEEGKFREAIQMDIDDIHDKFGDKYDDAIAEMSEYVDKLEEEGKINA